MGVTPQSPTFSYSACHLVLSGAPNRASLSTDAVRALSSDPCESVHCEHTKRVRATRGMREVPAQNPQESLTRALDAERVHNAARLGWVRFLAVTAVFAVTLYLGYVRGL